MSCSTHTCTASLQRCGGVPLPTPCPILTTVCSFLRFSSRERALSRVSVDSFLPAASGWPPGMTSISRDARSQYSLEVIGCLCCCIRYITRCVSSHYRFMSLWWPEFEPTISVGERPQTDALDRAATGTGNKLLYVD
jgi:hypothetical protein